MLLALLFLIVAIVYSLVGFGGGSSYLALMALYGIPYADFPKVALICNIIVVSGSSLLYLKEGHFRPWLFWPVVVGSVPMAFLGGLVPVSKDVFLILLSVTLLAAGLRLFFIHSSDDDDDVPEKVMSWPLGLAIGGLIGFVSGLVGIGGGIFLSPLLLNLCWGKVKSVAATASLFILVNSLAGLAGQFSKNFESVHLAAYWPLLLAVFLGGQIGGHLGVKRFSPLWVRVLTGLLVLFVGGRILLSQLN